MATNGVGAAAPGQPASGAVATNETQAAGSSSQGGAGEAALAAATVAAPDGASAAPAGAAAEGEGAGTLARKSGWRSAKTVLHGVKAAPKFQTLRDLIGGDSYIDPARLKLGRALGEGAFAKVQLAELLPADGSSGGKPRQVAVKALRQELLQDPEQVQLFGKEVALLRKLRHRHIVEFVGCSWTTGSLETAQTMPDECYFLQEYCAGGSLGDLVRRQMVQPFKKIYSDADALRWCLHVAMALQYLHESRPVVIHRDLKLENVMLVSADVAQADARLADFGLARLTLPKEQQKMDRVTRLLSQPRGEWDMVTRMSSKNLDAFLDCMLTGNTARSDRTLHVLEEGEPSVAASFMSSTFMSSTTTSMAEASRRALTGKTGSFGYMAPEVSRNQQYNAQADIFSLGMCMYNLFCRNIPSIQILLCGDESHLELYAAKVADGYRPPILPGLPASVVAAIEACWKNDPDLRPNARGVVEMLQAIRDSGDVGVSGADAHIAQSACCSVM